MSRLACLVVMCASRLAAAQAAPDSLDSPDSPASVKLGGYVEVYDAWSFRRPNNGVNNLRGFDDRYDSITVQNAVVDATWARGPVTGRVALQFGDAPDNDYQLEPPVPAQGTAPASTATEWRHVQEAWVRWASSSRLELSAGLFGSPLTPETIVTKDSWNWSRSNLYYLLPHVVAGARARHQLGDTHWSATVGVYNGWNNAIDDNHSPSVDALAAYAKGDWTVQVQYFGGIQRPQGAPEGLPWRHLFDAYAIGKLGRHLSFQLAGDGGWEHGAFGRGGWLGESLALRYDLTPRVYAAVRGDVFSEWRPKAARPMFLPYGVSWVSSGTATLSWRPVAGLDLRAEYRHDQAADMAYFGGIVKSAPTGTAIANRKEQDTVTGGVIAWF